MPYFTHTYSVITCPSCQADLTQEDAVTMTTSVGGSIREVPSRLDSEGSLEDVDDLLKNGYHSGSSCTACGAGLEDHQLIDDEAITKETIPTFFRAGADWTEEFSTSEAIERELPNLRFKGEGWYFIGKDVALILEMKINSNYMVQVWNNPDRDPRDVLRSICDLTNHTPPSVPKKSP